jgi:uridine phosphorylase
MSIIKNEIPLLEYDSDTSAVIMPGHEGLDMVLPEKAVYAFLGEEINRYAMDHNARIAAHFVSETKLFPVYVLEEDGEEICLMQAPVGAAAAAQILDWLISYGVSKIISAGACGALTDLPEGVFLVPSRALRDEGTSYHYQPPSRYMEVSEKAREAIEKALVKHSLPYMEVVTWSTDGFYRETRDKVEYRKSEGCSVVEMECSALAACAALRGALWGQLLYTADTLADTENYDERNWGGNAAGIALKICIDTLKYI